MGEKRELRRQVESLSTARDVWRGRAEERNRRLVGVIVERDDAIAARDRARAARDQAIALADECRAESDRRAPRASELDEGDVDPRLVATLQALGDNYGPLGVAIVAANLTDPGALTLAIAHRAEVKDTEATPEPRPFRVGDRVRVSEGATWRRPGFGASDSRAAGCDGRVAHTWSEDGDLLIDTGGVVRHYVSPEFCTLIEDESEVVLPLPEGYTFTAPEANVPAPPEPTRTGVTLHTHDGRELWIPCEDPDLEEGVNGLWVVPEGRLTHSVAYVNTAAIVAAVVTR